VTVVDSPINRVHGFWISHFFSHFPRLDSYDVPTKANRLTAGNRDPLLAATG
jgi:hypothetical protein